ncbi:MAG TPA: hypothetical protein VMT31_04330 [Methanomicrobiales archaeon]|jgi:hypothetical protein|nr:hypothetical protein [Methanomicrobiales archaeon]
MEIRSPIPDVVLTLVLVISTLVLVMRLWQDVVIAAAATLMMLSIAGLFLSLGRKIQRLDSSVVSRERTIRVNLEEMAAGMGRKYDATLERVDGVMQELSKRMYR